MCGEGFDYACVPTRPRVEAACGILRLDGLAQGVHYHHVEVEELAVTVEALLVEVPVELIFALLPKVGHWG